MASDERVDLKLLAKTNLPEFLSSPDLVLALGLRGDVESFEVLVGPVMDSRPMDALVIIFWGVEDNNSSKTIHTARFTLRKQLR